MKALEILKELETSLKYNQGNVRWDCSIDYFHKVNEAIKELEEINKKIEATKEFLKLKLNGVFDEENIRSCENCKHFTTYKGEYGTCKLGVNNRKIEYLHNSFYCNIWQEK